MAKKTKRPVKPPPKQKEEKLYIGENVTWLSIPNNLMSVYVRGEDDRECLGALLARRYCWPLLAAMVGNTTAQQERGVFVHEMHGQKHWADWADHAPSWMDPHLFISLAMQDERVLRVLRVAFRKNDADAWQRLLPLFQDILDKQYLPLLFERFADEAAPLLANWLLRHYAQQQLDKPT